MSETRPVDLAVVGEALSNRDRHAVLRVLSEHSEHGGMKVRDVLAKTGYPPAALQTVRRHLVALEAAGLVKRELVGKAYVYTVDHEGVRAAAEALLALNNQHSKF